MKRLDKDDTQRKAALADELDAAYTALDAAIADYNLAVATKWIPVQSAIDNFNEVTERAQGFRDDVARQIEDYMGERTEKWLEGERGQAYEEWRSAWDSAQLGTIELVQPDDIDLDIFEIQSADTLRDLEDEVAQ